MTADGFFRTGDIGVMDARGYTKIVDRKKDMILVSGFNVYPNEIEEVIASHPGVLECAVIGVADSKSGEAVKAFIVKKDQNLTPEEIIKYCGTQSPPTRCPSRSSSGPTCPRPMSARSCAANCATRRRLRPEGARTSCRWLKLPSRRPAFSAFWRDAGPKRWYTARRRVRRGGTPALFRPVAAARQPANYRHGKRAMTARWRSSSCSTSFPATCSAAMRGPMPAMPWRAKWHAAPSNAAWTRGSIRFARIPLSAVHAFGASGRPVALHRAVTRGRPCRKPEMGRAPRRYHPAVRPLSPSQPPAGPRDHAGGAGLPRPRRLFALMTEA